MSDTTMQSAYATVQAIIPWTIYAVLPLTLWLAAAYGAAGRRVRAARGDPHPRRGWLVAGGWGAWAGVMVNALSLMRFDMASFPNLMVHTAVLVPLAVIAAHLLGLRGTPGGVSPINVLLFRPLDATEPRGRQRLRESLVIGLVAVGLTAVGLASLGLRPCGWLDLGLGVSGCERMVDAGDTVETLSPSADAALLAVAAGKEFQIWDTAAGRRLTTVPASDSAQAAALSPDGTLLATSAYGSPVRLLRADGAPVRELTVDEAPRRLAFSPDGKLLAAAAGGSVVVWRVDDGRQLWSRDVAGDEAYTVAFSPDGQLLATGVDNGAIQIWDAAGGDLRQTLRADTTYELAFSPDGALLAGAGYRQSLSVWRTADGQMLWSYRGANERGYMSSVAFTPDGAQVLGGSDDDTLTGKVVTLRTADGGVAGTLRLPADPRSLAVMTGGRVAIGLRDDTIRIWRLPLPEGGQQ